MGEEVNSYCSYAIPQSELQWEWSPHPKTWLTFSLGGF